ncbi:hypothetical protein, partial [Campylobacter troglodytis]|uniref:hypothetical protein n=1 Tax=Campylobacter troglodytis TaxID=654363 RepID=UPI001C8EDB93
FIIEDRVYEKYLFKQVFIGLSQITRGVVNIEKNKAAANILENTNTNIASSAINTNTASINTIDTNTATLENTSDASIRTINTNTEKHTSTTNILANTSTASKATLSKTTNTANSTASVRTAKINNTSLSSTNAINNTNSINSTNITNTAPISTINTNTASNTFSTNSANTANSTQINSANNTATTVAFINTAKNANTLERTTTSTAHKHSKEERTYNKGFVSLFNKLYQVNTLAAMCDCEFIPCELSPMKKALNIGLIKAYKKDKEGKFIDDKDSLSNSQNEIYTIDLEQEIMLKAFVYEEQSTYKVKDTYQKGEEGQEN